MTTTTRKIAHEATLERGPPQVRGDRRLEVRVPPTLLLQDQKPASSRSYAVALAAYFGWLRTSKSVTMDADEMVRDDLLCVFKSDSVDVLTKRRHTDWLDGYINGEMLEKGYSASRRTVTAAAVKKFYERNDSALFGDFEVAKGRPEAPPAPLTPDEVRKVLRILPVGQRLPLLVTWQSAMEKAELRLGVARRKLEPFYAKTDDGSPLERLTRCRESSREQAEAVSRG